MIDPTDDVAHKTPRPSTSHPSRHGLKQARSSRVQSIWVLHLYVERAEKLHNADGMFGKSDPYVSVSINQDELNSLDQVLENGGSNLKSSRVQLQQLALTPVLRNTLKPIWKYHTEVRLALGGNDITQWLKHMKLTFTV